MVGILHRVGTRTALTDVHAALTTAEGLAGWWTTEVTADTEVGGKLAFRFGDVGGFDMELTALTPPTAAGTAYVAWRVVDGPAEWIDTTITWTLERRDDWTIVLFEHAGWREPVEFMAHCSTKWATFLLSLLALVETGEGHPAPYDVKVSDWH